MGRQALINELQEDPEFIAGIKSGMHDLHLGHMFSHKLVFGSLDSTGGRFWRYYWLIVNLKELWWRIKAPYQRLISHRTCSQCKEYRSQSNLEIKE